MQDAAAGERGGPLRLCTWVYVLWFMSFAGEGVWPCIDEGKAGAAFDAYFFSQLARPDLSPRSAASGQVMCCTYENWFATRPFAELDMSLPAAWRSEALEVGGLCKAHLFNLLRFRLGAHSLRVAEGRWERLPRDRRLCERCTEGVVEDEFHLVFECPAYDSVRANYAQLFEDFSAASSIGRDMAGFMNQNVQQVASFIHTCFVVRSGAWSSSQSTASSDEEFHSVASGGSDVELVSGDSDSGSFVSVESAEIDGSVPHEPVIGS